MSNPTDIDGGELPVVEPSGTPCRHLRNKGMYVYTDGSGGEPHQDYDNSIFWCLQTMKGFGPDDEFVGREECRDLNRPCYEPL
ncbi:MAG: hypothetical protein U0835_06950 [Isosphaeraceae bacterium]